MNLVRESDLRIGSLWIECTVVPLPAAAPLFGRPRIAQGRRWRRWVSLDVVVLRRQWFLTLALGAAQADATV